MTTSTSFSTRGSLGDTMPSSGRQRAIIEAVRPAVDAGRFPVKRCPGEKVIVEADAFADGHDSIGVALLYRKQGDEHWSEAPMDPLGNDRWHAQFAVSSIGRYEYTVEAWVDHFRTWRKDMFKRIDAGQNIRVDLLIGAGLIEASARRASAEDAARLSAWANELRAKADDPATATLALDGDLAELALRHPDRSHATRYDKELIVVVDREIARFGAWYEVFPRSCTAEPGRHATFADVESYLPYFADMGFDVLYFPPIHPVGRTNRKGKNNVTEAAPDDVGSPWGIGSEHGGHTAIEPALGSLDDFRRLVVSARRHGLEVALDLAYQCTPDHPYVREHPEWFQQRPDGTIQYAENPPKKYQDIYPINFETENWRELWEELRRVVLYWIDNGIRIFRVDNPHTKAFPFWEWMINTVQADHPDTVFLAEAFTRPKVMYRLAKLGFSQSYTYFTWRNTKHELMEYFTELTQTDVREFLRPNLWPNTPDILSEYLQLGGPPAFRVRYALAATLGASYGIYGPAFELCENTPREPGSEEYLHSEKYEIRHWNLDAPHSLRGLIAAVNRIRKENPALQNDWGLRFHEADNPEIIAYSKATEDLSNVVLIIVNLDVHHTQSGWVTLDLAALGIDQSQPYQAHDLLSGERYLWEGATNFIRLEPSKWPAHILSIRRHVRTERDFDYYR